MATSLTPRVSKVSIPDYQSIMLPLLRYAADGNVHTFGDTVEELAGEFKLTREDRAELLPSGRQATFNNRVGWARTYLAKAGLLQSPKRGQFRITERGKQVLAKKPEVVNVAFLAQFQEFRDFRSLRHQKPEPEPGGEDDSSSRTPEEQLESAFQGLRQDLIAEVIENVKNCSAEFFERLVVDLLVKMGYGGSRQEAGQAVGKRSGDEGIDGIIKEDRLGLDIIYIQAKKWENTVGRPEIQKFAGALQGQRAKKGIFLTTAEFSREARDYVSHIDSKIILIDGNRLAELMIDHNVGVSPEVSYEVKRIDSDYFTEE
jgi:restriction system protein